MATTSVRIWGMEGRRVKSAHSEKSYTVLQAVKLPVCLCHRKVAPIKLIENPSPLVHPNSKQGKKREKMP